MTDITDRKIKSWISQAANESNKTYINHYIAPNLWLRITTKTQTAVFVYRVSTKTINTWYTIGEYPLITLHDARCKAHELKILIKQDINPIQQEREKHSLQKTVQEVYNIMIDNLKNKGISQSSLVLLNTFNTRYLSLLSNRLISDITPNLIRTTLLDPVIAQGKINTAKTILLRFKQLARFAYEREYTETNVLERLKNDFFTPTFRNRILTNEEISKLISWYNESNCDSPSAHIILSLMLGTRLVELLTLKWENVNLEDGTILLTETKNKLNLLIKLPPQAKTIIESLYKIKLSEYVFSNGKKHFSEQAINTRIKKICESGIAKFSHHDLRRTFSSKLAELGFSLDLIDSATNHKLQGIRQNYVHTNRLEERYQMLCTWCNYLDEISI